MITSENQNKITNVENLLKTELSTIVNLKNNEENDKQYLMNSLESLSKTFNSNSDINEQPMLPHLFRTLNDSLSKVNTNILKLKELEINVNTILLTLSYYNNEQIVSEEELSKELSLYNQKKNEAKNTILNNSTYVKHFISSSKSLINSLTQDVDNSKENIIKQFKENREKNYINNSNAIIDSQAENNNENCNTEIKGNDTLLISEKQEKIFLPYTLEDLSKFNEHNEKSLEDVIRDNFIIPLNTFKNPTISRFKAAYNLAKNKSNYSLLKSFNLAVEVMFKHNLNPAIIIACKNVDELKDYLSCLKEQKLDLFKPFKIKYEMNPMKIN